MTKNKRDLGALFKRIGAFFIHNWPWKLLSLFLAVCLWSGLITQDETLTREKVFNNVTINVQNADILRRSGFIIVDGISDLPTARIRAAVPQNNYNTVTAANYNLRVDLSRIREAGEQTLTVLASNSSLYGTVTEISVPTVTVQVEEFVSRSRIPVRLNMTGEIPKGFYAGEARVDPSFVTVSGPKSVVENVVRCVADYSASVLSPQSGTERTAVPFRLLDDSGSVIDNSLIEVSIDDVLLDSMVVEQTLYAARELVINTADLVTGMPADGYEIKRVSAEPAVITAAGADALIASLNELHLVEYIDRQIDIDGLHTPITRSVSLSKPEGIAHFSSDTIMITVEIAPK